DPVMDALPIMRIGGLVYPAYNLVVIGVGVVAALLLWAVIYRTKFGVMLRATSQDRRMASALGLNVGLVYVSAFAIGCFMAGLGGYRPKLRLFPAAPLVLVLLALLPLYIGLYQTQLLTYGLIAAIAALGFNLLLGYTGLLSFGHSAFFGIGAYSVAFLLRDAG